MYKLIKELNEYNQKVEDIKFNSTVKFDYYRDEDDILVILPRLPDGMKLICHYPKVLHHIFAPKQISKLLVQGYFNYKHGKITENNLIRMYSNEIETLYRYHRFDTLTVH